MSELTPQQVRMARAVLRLGVIEFAELCDVSHFTVSRIEKADTMPDVRPSTRAKIVEALKAQGFRLYNGRTEQALFTKNPGAVEAPGSSLALPNSVEP